MGGPVHARGGSRAQVRKQGKRGRNADPSRHARGQELFEGLGSQGGGWRGHIALCSNGMGPENAFSCAKRDGRGVGEGCSSCTREVMPIRPDRCRRRFCSFRSKSKYLPRGRAASVSGVTSSDPRGAVQASSSNNQPCAGTKATDSVRAVSV